MARLHLRPRQQQQDEDDDNSDQGNDSEEDTYEINRISSNGRQGSSNRNITPSTSSTLQSFINTILTEEQRTALKNKECFYCKKQGHWARNCPSKKTYNNKRNQIPRNDWSRNNDFKNRRNRRNPQGRRPINNMQEEDQYDKFDLDQNF